MTATLLQTFRIAILFSVAGTCCFAQLATIQGEIRDPSNAVVPGANLRITNLKTGVSQSTTSNQSGYYSVPGLIPGSYTVEAADKGFQTAIYKDLTLEVNQTARVDFTLQPGIVTQTINVSGEPTALNTETSTVGQVISNQTVVQLPLNGRNYLQLAQLTAGVTPPTGMRNSAEDSFAALGQQVYQTNILLDGIDNATRAAGGELGYQMQAVKPSVDAVEQFQVATDNVSAEYGGRMGATVIVETKSGANQLHGSLYEFLRNGDLDATSFFSVGQPKPPFHQNQFGGTVGGPIIKNKLFYFGSIESLRIDAGTTNISLVPTDAEKAGNYAGRPTIFDPATTAAVGSGDTRTPFPNNIIPASRFDPVSAKVIALYPEPNLNNPANNYYFSSPQTSVQNEYDGRGDYNVTESERFFVRYSHRDFTELEPGNLPLPAAGGKWETVDLHANNITGNLDSTLSPTATNELRIGYSRVNSLLGVPDTVDYNSQLGIKGLPPGLGAANDTGLTLFSPSNYAQVGTQNYWPNTNNFGIYQINDTFSKVLGTHVMKFGVQLMREYNYRLASRFARGNMNFNGSFTEDPNNRGTTGDPMADFLLGEASGGTLGNPQGEAMLMHNYAAFFQDDWRVTPKLTLNLGVRWDRFGPPSYHHIPAADYLFQYGSPNYSVVYPTSMSDCGCIENNLNFSPRLGVAYQATPNTVIRAGFGTYYGEPSVADQDGARYFIEPPTWSEISFPTDRLFQPALIVSQGFPAGLFPVTTLQPNSSVQTALPSKANQYTIEWFFDVQRQLPGNIVVTASYMGEGARHIAWTQNLNTPLTPGPGVLQSRRPWPFFSSINYYPAGADMNYNGLALKAEKRYSNGLVFIASYTWSHDIDDGNGLSLNDDTSSIRDPYNLALDRGNAAYDLRQAFVTSFNYDLPFGKGKHWLNRGGPVEWVLGGWQLGGILTLQTGPYFTPQLSVDLANMGTTNFPNAIANPNLPSGQRSIHDWFNLAAFTLPQQYTFGNAGRNVIEGPPLHNMDLKIGKVFPIHERLHLDFRAEMFNFTNTPNFATPGIGSGPATINSPNEGTITSTVGNPRQIQFALKLIF